MVPDEAPDYVPESMKKRLDELKGAFDLIYLTTSKGSSSSALKFASSPEYKVIWMKNQLRLIRDYADHALKAVGDEDNLESESQ